MTIATFQFEDIGAHIYGPEGPFGTSGAPPQASFKPGDTISGDNGAEFIYVLLNAVTAMTLNQGDTVCWDNTLVASRTGEISVINEYDIGLNVGTVFLGGRVGDVAAAPFGGNVWSATLAVGVYGIWVQRAGVSLCNISATTTLAIPSTIGGTKGRITFLAVPTKSNAIAPGSLAFIPTSKTFTADALAGSTTLLNANVGKWLQRGMTLTGTGIPGTTTAAVTTIVDINGPTITMSAAATATNVGTTVTALTNSTSGTTVSGSPTLSGIPTIAGIYPNQTITGTGVPASTTVLAINGTGGSYTITMSANATATSAAGVFVSFTTTAMPNYNEVMLNWPYYTAATSA